MFPRISELSESARTAEIGDCYSLLGRTHLVAGDFYAAERAAREGIDRIHDKESKDYADLQILLGDLTARRGDKAGAERFYDGAIHVADCSDAEKSEIAARAWYQKGIVNREGRCFDRAADIWELLEEYENAGRAKLKSMELAKRIPPDALPVLKSESASVQVEAIRIHEARVVALPGGHRGRRSATDENYWGELIVDARKNVRVSNIEW